MVHASHLAITVTGSSHILRMPPHLAIFIIYLKRAFSFVDSGSSNMLNPLLIWRFRLNIYLKHAPSLAPMWQFRFTRYLNDAVAVGNKVPVFTQGCFGKCLPVATAFAQAHTMQQQLSLLLRNSFLSSAFAPAWHFSVQHASACQSLSV